MPSLSMPLYVSPTDVANRMQVNGELAGVNVGISSSIIGAQIQVEALTGSKLGVVAQDSIYELDPDAFSGIHPGGQFRLEIPSGFIRDTPAMVITTGDKWNDITTSVDLGDVRVDKKRGYVSLDANDFASKYVRVQCSTGFATLSTPAFALPTTQYSDAVTYTTGNSVWYLGARYVALSGTTGVPPLDTDPDLVWAPILDTVEQVPYEITEAIMAYVPVIFDASQTTNRNQEEEPQAKKAYDRAQLILGPYLRMKGFSFRAL